MEAAMDELQVRVLRKTPLAQDIVALELARADGGALPAFSAGAHVDLHLPGGLVRQYSLCNDEREAGRYRIAVLREPASRGGSAAVHEAVAEGALLRISAPRNHFPLQRASRTLLLAGGIGITPLLAMAQRLAAIEADFALHYCTRTPARCAFADEIAAAPWAKRAHLHFDDGPPDQRLDLAALLAQPEPDTHVYVCGPAGFIDHVLDTARAQGWPEAQLHKEYFGAAPQAASGDGSFAVRIASSGLTCTVAPGQSVVQALAAQGVEIMVSCEQGVCGTCLTRVLEGECEHRDLYLTDEEKAAHDQFTPCCSRARTPLLVLDL